MGSYRCTSVFKSPPIILYPMGPAKTLPANWQEAFSLAVTAAICNTENK